MQQLPRTANHRGQAEANRRKSHAGSIRCWLKPRVRWPSFRHRPTIPCAAERFAFREFRVAGQRAQDAVVAESPAERELELKIELGRTQVCSDDLVELRRGSVVSLDKSIHEPADIVLNGQIVARGEVLCWKDIFACG